MSCPTAHELNSLGLCSNWLGAALYKPITARRRSQGLFYHMLQMNTSRNDLLLLLLAYSKRMTKVILVTGANSGVGLALCKRLLVDDTEGVQLCLGCRNMQRARAARSALLSSRPSARVDVLQMDTSSASSIISAAQEFKRRYNRLDYLYLNAGIMPNPQFNVRALFRGLFSGQIITMLATGVGILTQKDSVTSDGFQEVFVTNLFGHFLLFRELEPVLCQGGQTSHLIWTSSSNAQRSAFDLEDIQHKRGCEPYSSSKYASDLLSLALNTHYIQQGLYSSVTCPGFVMTNLTYGVLPSVPAFIWTLLMPVFWLIRIFTNTFTLTPDNGAEALFWLLKQKPESLDPYCKYHSLTSGLGYAYTDARKMDIDLKTSEALYEKLLQLESEVREKVTGKPKASHVSPGLS